MAACRAAIDDDGPREVLADALGGERGEFVMLQLALDGGEGTNDQRRRARKLAAEHGAAWSELEGLANRITFRRGFVDAIEVNAQTLIDHRDEIFARAPLCEHVVLTGMNGQSSMAAAVAQRHAAISALPELRGLYIDAASFLRPDASGELRAWSVSEYGAQLETLGVESVGLGERDNYDVTGARRVWFDATFDPTLRQPNMIAMRFVATFPYVKTHESVTELEVLGATIYDLDAPQLERLTCDLVQLAYQPRRLSRFPRLRSLTITDLARSSGEMAQTVEQWAALTHPALRELRAINLSEEAVFALARSLGPQLRLLDVRGSAAELYLHHAELQALVAGDVVTGGHVELRPISWLGRRPRELMWDHPLIELRR